MQTTLPALHDALDIALTGETVDFFGYQTGGDYLFLPQVPKISDNASNKWVDLTTALTHFTVVEVDNDGAWEPITLVASLPVSETQGYLHISDRRLSNRIYVHENHRGKQFHVQYTGIGSLISTYIIDQLLKGINRLEDGIWLSPFSLKEYSLGRWDSSESNDKTIWISPSSEYILGINGKYAQFPGMEVNFDEGGNCEISEFANPFYWKRILLAADFDGSWIFLKKESDEQTDREDLETPEPPHGWRCVCTIDVQNNGNVGTIGAINAIQQSHISKHKITFHDQPFPITFLYSGTLLAGELFDNVQSPGIGGEIERFVLTAGEDTGTSGKTRLNIYKHSESDPSGVSLFSDQELMPNIQSFSGEYAVNITPQENFITSERLFASGNSFRVMVEEAAPNARDFTGILWLRLHKF